MKQTLDPDLLRTFVTITEGGSFRDAASKIGRSQSATSMQIQKLEQILGESLFTRERPAVRLTKKGEALLIYARRILQLQDEAVSNLVGTAPNDTLHFGIPDDYARGLLPTILTRFAQEHPLIEVTITCAPSATLEKMVEENTLEAAIVSRSAKAETSRFLKKEAVVWVASPNHAVGRRAVVPLAVFQADCMIRRNAIAALAAEGRDFRVAFSSPNLAALIAVVDSGLAIAAMPLSSVPPELTVLKEREGFPPLPSIDLFLTRGRIDEQPAVDAFADCLGEIEWS
ncbi:LysR substrate-binding domain-containing protein [uncultured Roseobacter sp.]|uniref:LysR substrate-binding domain-containing protein n=1 Tax=uncultured Roseobacter sp. TaxID=114847 RepID=UPI002618170D|nr:LysR substrate-binding domain-containing protein [uncultured Roseobacter sp.]